jgi:hypothetical protein
MQTDQKESQASDTSMGTIDVVDSPGEAADEADKRPSRKRKEARLSPQKESAPFKPKASPEQKKRCRVRTRQLDLAAESSMTPGARTSASASSSVPAIDLTSSVSGVGLDKFKCSRCLEVCSVDTMCAAGKKDKNEKQL